MKLTTKKDIEAPIAQVWESVADHEAWERSAMRRGIEVERLDSLRQAGPGMKWKARFGFRGKPRDAELTLTELTAPHSLGLVALSDALEVTNKVELIEMSARRTRIHVVAEIKPRSLGARLFLQSLRLARAKVDRRFDSKVSQLAVDLEKRARKG